MQDPEEAHALEGAVRLDRIRGCLLGLALGDALGLPREGLGARRARRIFPGPLEHRLLFGLGWCSDDTEHACMAGQALLASGGEARAFARNLGWRLRFWLLALPAGVGFGTLRALLRLWIGFPPSRAGVASAGNGPAMRAPLLGALARPESGELEAWVEASTRLTHRDPHAEDGAHLVARAAQAAVWREGPRLDPGGILALLRREARTPAFREALALVERQLQGGGDGKTFATALGCPDGVSGYVLHTVPAVLFCWLRHPSDFREALEAVVDLGGDTDTTGAILGGLAGATLGAGGLPASWVAGLAEWPRSGPWMEALATRLALRFPAGGRGSPLGSPRPAAPPLPGPLGLPWPLLPLRNLAFLLVVLGHGFRRLLPPY